MKTDLKSSVSGCKDLNNCKCQIEHLGEDPIQQKVVVVKDQVFQVPVFLENKGSEPAFDTRLTLTLPYNVQLPKGFICQNETESSFNREVEVKTLFYIFWRATFG